MHTKYNYLLLQLISILTDAQMPSKHKKSQTKEDSNDARKTSNLISKSFESQNFRYYL